MDEEDLTNVITLLINVKCSETHFSPKFRDTC